MVNYEVLYLQEADFRKALQLELSEFKERADEIEQLLEAELQVAQEELSNAKSECDDLKAKMATAKATYSKEKHGLEQQVECMRKSKEELQETCKVMKMKLIQAENDVEYLESQNRALQTLNEDLEHKIDSVLEELALLQTELEENRAHHQKYIESIERLKQQVRDTENELMVEQMKSHDRASGASANATAVHTNASASVYVSSFIQNSPQSTSESISCSTTTSQYDMDNKEHQQERLQERQQNRRVKPPNLTYSFKPAEIESLSKLYIDNQKEKLLLSHSHIQKTFAQIPIKQQMNSPVNPMLDSAGSVGTPSMHARGRKMTNPNTPIRQRYSEEKRRMQQQLDKITNEKMQIVDRNFNATEIGFNKTLHFVSNLIKDIGETMGPLRTQKAIIAATPRDGFKKIQFNPEMVS